MRTLCVGDVHGSAKALEQCLDRANVTEVDKLIFLGDYVDGWSESKQVIDKLIELNNSNECIFIRGNHDQWFIDFINNGSYLAEPIWYNQGGKSTLESYGANVELGYKDFKVKVDIPDNHIEFLQNTILYYIDNNNKGFVHAGYQSFKGLGHDTEANYMWDRDIAYILRSRSTDPIPRVLRPHNELYIGHTTTMQWSIIKPISRDNKYFNLDTGCGWSGVLTIMDIESKEYWQSDFSKDLYPNEKGR